LISRTVQVCHKNVDITILATKVGGEQVLSCRSFMSSVSEEYTVMPSPYGTFQGTLFQDLGTNLVDFTSNCYLLDPVAEGSGKKWALNERK
jgi:hypothetical protein